MNFSPSAPLHLLEKRAQLLKQLRAFFAERHLLEVDVPAISPYTVTDVYVDALKVDLGTGRSGFLQTSPEYYLKRCLARDRRSIYYLGKAYRSELCGPKHRSEFSMLEWYRVGFDDRQLIAEVQQLLRYLAPTTSSDIVSYGQLFESYLGCNPHLANCDQLAALAKSTTSFDGHLPSKSEWLDLLFSLCVEPHLMQPTVVYDYPAEQSALARITQHERGYPVARRFEVFWCGLELANGYWELADADEQLQRFEADRRRRQQLHLPDREVDPQFIAALRSGLPDCAGIAMGVERLLMCLTDQSDIQSVMPFANY